MKILTSPIKFLTAVWFYAASLLFSTRTALAEGITVIPDESCLIQIFNFVFLIFILNIVLFKPIRKILSQRKEKITGFETGINNCFSEIEDKGHAYKNGIKSARSKGIAEKDLQIEQAAAEEGKIISELNAKMLAEMNEMKERVSRQMSSIREQLDQEIDVFAEAIGEKILGRMI